MFGNGCLPVARAGGGDEKKEENINNSNYKVYVLSNYKNSSECI
jgi:hypothetical protein